MSKYEFDGDKVKKLYGAMQKLGYQQSLGEFEKGFYGKDNYQKRKAVYDVMTENGADLGSSYEDFIGRMRATSSSGGVSKSATNPTNKAAETKTFEMPWEKKNKVAKRGDAILHGGGGAFLRDQEVLVDEGYRLVSSKLMSERVEDPKSKRLITKPKKYRVPESDVREGGSMVRMVDAYKTVDGRAVPIPSAATSTQGNENQDEDFATQYISGKINREEYKKKAKAKDNEAAIANSQPTMEGDEEFLYRTDKRYKEYRDKILNGDGDIDELSPETKAWYLERVEARIKDAEERQKKYLSIINSDEHQKKLKGNDTGFWSELSREAAGAGAGAVNIEQSKHFLRETDHTNEMDLANAGLGATESELTDLHALRDMLKGKDVGFFRRFKDFFGNRNNLTFGFQEAADDLTLIGNKNNKTQLVSSAAESKAKESEAATMYSRSANLRAKAGSVTAEMIPYVIEMALSGGLSSAASKGVRALVHAGGKALMKSAFKKGVERSLMKSLGAGAIRWGTRGIEWVAGATAAGAVVATTTGAGETAANITGRMVGQGAKQEDGSYAFEGGEGAVGAVLHGFTSQLIENATEFMGGGLGYGVGKVTSKLTKPLAKVGLGGVTDFFGRIAASPISKATSKTLSKFQIQGIPEEIGEEYLGWAGHSMAGDGDAEWSDFADFQKHKELWATMALSVGAMGAFAASGHVPSLLKRRGRSLKMADRAAAGAFSDEEKWNALRDKLDGTDNNNVLRSLYDNVMQDKSLNGRERKAAMLYAGNLLAYRGANLGAIAGKRLALEQKRSDAEDARRAAMVEGAAFDDAERIDEHELDGGDVVSSAFRQGYEETSAANAYLWAKTLEEQEGHAMEVLGLSEKELNEKFSSQNAGETLNEMRKAPDDTYTEEQKKAAFDYANTRAAYEGVVERTQDDIDSEIAYHHAIVDRQTNIDFGRLHPVKLFTSEKNKRDDAFLVSGRLAFEYNDKGESVVSTRLSDPTLVVSDAAGRTRMVSPSEVADAEDAIDVDEYKNTLAEHVRQEMEERKYAEMLKAAEESQANEVKEGEAEVPAVEGESTSEEENETPEVSENGEQSNVFGDAFNVGDKFTTEDGEFEVVQLTEGEAPIVQNVETGQQFRPHSEEDLRAAVRSYTPAFIDGAENAEGVTTYSRVGQKETAPQNDAQEGSQQEQEDLDSLVGRSLTETEAKELIHQMEDKSEVAPTVELTRENWDAIFGKDGKVMTPIFEVKMGEHQFDKMSIRNRGKQLGMVKPTLQSPDVIVQEESGAEHSERNSSYVFVKTFTKEDGSRYYYFTSITVQNGGLEIVISNHEKRANKISKLLQEGKIAWINEKFSLHPIAQVEESVPLNDTNKPTSTDNRSAWLGINSSESSHREDTETSENEQGNDEDSAEIPPEKVFLALDKGEIEGITPQMAHDALYGDPDLETEEVDAIVENSRSTSQANLAKLQKTEIKPRKNESVVAFKKRKAAHIAALAHAEELVRFWEDVQEHRRNLGVQAMQEEENAKQQREAEAAERAKEQAENGLAVAPSWANAEKIVGRPGEFITPNGLRVKGHYVLVESGAAVPSHDARHGFKQSEGFPTDEKGHTLNDRDYERDLDAQRVQREIARNYDARATQQPVVVSPEGFVLSGNGRTMSGDLAAMENTDGAYNSYVREYPEMWGFTSDQVEKLEHPRVVFVSDNPLPLTTETFAAFNAQETKTQSRTEKAVKMGKAVSDEDFAKILRVVTDGHETLADFYGNMSGVSEVINLLETSGVITQQDRANLFDGDALSDEGRNLLENVLLGKAFEGNPDVVRQLSEVRSLRTSVLNALFYIVENERLNEEFRLGDELSRAINFVYHARKGGGYSFGDKVRTFAQQTELFESTTDVSLEDATVLLLADALNDKRTTLVKSIFKSYNERAEDAGRGQMSLFGDALPSRETLIKETLALLGVDIKDYVPSNQVERSNQATNEQQQEPKQQQQPEAGTSEPTSEQGAEGKTETELPSGSVSTSGRGNEGVSTEEEGAKPSDKNAKPSEKSTEKGEKAEDIEVDASAEKESVPLKEEEGINESSRGGSLQDEKEKDKADSKLTTRQRVTKAKERGGREWIDSLRTTTDSHYLRLATDVGYISAPEAQAIIRNPHTKDDVLNLLLRKLEANYFGLYQTDVAEEMARRSLSAEDLQRLYDIAMKDPRAYRFYNALDAIAQNKNTPESVLDELYKRAIKEGRRLDKDGNYVDLGLRLAQNPSTSESHLRTLALTYGEDVAKNPSAPVDLLRVFATEKKSPYGSYYVLRAAVAQNPSTPADLLLEILRTSDREEAAVGYTLKHSNLKGADLEDAAELASNPSIFNNPNVTDELLEKWASVRGKSKKAKAFAELAKMKLDERRASKAEEGKAHLTKSQRELLELVRNPNATAEELQRAYEGEYYDEDDAKQVKKAKELAKVRKEVVRAVAAHPNASSTVLYEIYYSEGEEDPELQRIIESRKDDTIGEDILGSKPNGRIREQRVGKSDIVVGQTVYFRGTPWKVESVSPNGKLTITTEISGHILRHENILPNWLRLSPVEEKQSNKELSHANNTVSEEQGDAKSARENNSEDLNSTESRDKDYADAVARGDIETAERMLAEEAERKGYSLDSPYQGESAFNGKAPSDSGYYENAEERKKAYDEGDYEGDWSLADEIVRGVDMGALVKFRLSDNELRRANEKTRESILNLREVLRRARSGEKNITIKMYRSVPPGVKEREFRNGDWITPSRLYALDNAEIHEGYEGENQEGWNGGYRIIEQEVPIEDVWWDGNDVNEWGYDNGEREAYRNTENNRKAFSVTYDSEGNLIPLSKRFDETNSDARYSKGEEQRVSNENALAGVSPEQIELRDGLVDIMRNAGMDVSVSDAEGQRVLDLARGVQAASDEEEMTRAQEYTDAIARGELEAVENMRAVDSAEDGKLRVTSLSMDAEVPVVEVKPHMFKGNAKEAIRQIKTWAKANIARIYNNEETGGKGKIRISNTAIDKYLSLSSSKKSDSLGVHLSVLVELPQIIRFSVLIEQHSDVQKGVDGVRSVENGINKDVLISRLYGAIQMDGKTYRVKTTIRDNVNNTDTPRAHSYEVTKIELLDTSAETPQMEQVHPVKVSNNSITLAKLLNNVEFSYEKGRKITDELQKNAFQLRGEMAEVDVVREAREIERANAVFNAELDAFSEDNANRIIFSLGRPSEVLRAAGVSDMPMKLYGNKLLKKIKKHGFDKVALRDLPRAVANPIAVFNNYEQEGNRAILTELHTEQGNVLVAIDLGKGADVDFNVVSSAFGKGQNGVVEWINKGQLTYVDKEKALNYLHLAAPIAAASDNQKLSLAANVINGFKNPKLSGENLRQQRENSITEEMQSIKTKAQSDGTFMLAPNGEPTNLTERQWLQVRTEAFKEWFGDWENDPEEASQMKDENGEPKVFYHNTNADFFAFNPLYNGSSTDAGWLGDGFYFYGDPYEGRDYGEKKMSVFLNIREPYYASEEENRSLSEQNDRSVSLAFREERESEGYDGVYFNGDLRQETVVFSPSQIKSATDNVGAFDKENDDIRFYRGQHGEVRGFAVGGRIYLDPKMASDETAIHEYTHLWADALRRVNPAEWGNVKDLLRGTPIWEETKRLYPELSDDEDALADEVLAQYSGKHGAKRLAEAREKAMSEADGVFDKAKVASVFDNVRQALKRFWKGVADFLGLHFTSAEEVADKVLSDLLNGVNPNDVIANTKDSIREQRIDKDTREEMQRSVDDLRVEVREGYEKAVKNWKYKIKEQWQDSMLALKTLQEQFEKQGAKIEEWENAYWAENRMSSMNEEEMKAYTRDYFKPIVAAQMAASKALPQALTDKLNAMDAHLREFEKMNAEEKKRNAVDNYMMLKHGLERNRVLAMRDAIDAQWENPSEASSVWRAYNEDAGNRENRRLLQEGKRSFEEFLQVDDAIRAHYAGEEYLKNREKDYSGLTSMTTEELTELKDVENAALQLVKEAEDAAGGELSALWDKVNKATRESVEKLYKSGLLTPAAYSQMTTMFQWYVPLRGFAEETSDEVYDYVDQRSGNGMGAVLKGADGRKSKADSPIAHIGSMAERSIVQGNRNLMKQHFYRMVMDHPSDLVSMGEIYLHHNEVTDEWEMMTPTHSPNATPEQIADETRAFEERMQELVQQEPDNYLRLREHPDVPYRVLGSNLGEHQMLVKVLGRDKLLTVNGDPRVAQAVNGRFNPDAAQSLAGKSVRALNRVLAQMATQSNPEFIFRNMFRDRSYAMKASLVKDGARYWRRLERNWVVGLGQVIGLSKRYENGTLNMNNELDKTFHEFMMNGGATGVTRLLNPEDYKGEITDIAKELQRGKYSVVKLTKLMKKYIDFFGSCSELITRFAAYRTSREMGRSVARAVWDAKEISTNFNKKGAGSKALRKNDGLLVRTSGELASFFRNYVIFTNANIQGFHNQWQIAKKHPLRFALNFAVRGLFTGFLMTLANRLLVSAFGDDDDRYMDLPESARRSNLCFFVPGLGWVKFPLGFNYRSFYGLGGLMAERVFMPDESYESFMKSARSLVLDMLPVSIRDSEQPLWLNLVPSGVRPMAEVAVNEDWSGRPIVNEYTNENWPEYRRANNHTGYISTEISQGLNYLTGGDEYTPGFINLNPSSMEHIALGLLSGVGTLMGNSFETGSALWHGEVLDTQHIPFLRDFLARNNQITHASSVKHNFYALKDEYEKTKVRVKGYEKEEADGKNDPESVARRVDFRKNSKEYKRYEVMDGAVRTENKIRKYMKEATTPEEVKKLEADLQKVMEDAINGVRAIK